MTQHSEHIAQNNSEASTTEATTTATSATTDDSAASAIAETTAAERKKAKSRAANRAAVRLLCETYPQTFSITEPKPLKVGIQEELIADGKLSQNKIKRGLASYVRAYAYLRSQTDGADRVNLKGEADGAVTASEAAHAAGKLPARRESKPRGKSTKEAYKRGARRPNKPTKQTSHQSKKGAVLGQAKVEKTDKAFQGLDDNQRMASKLDMLLSKHK